MLLRASLSQEINKYNEKLMGYLASMSYNYCQLCVTADPSSMLSINIEMDGEVKHIEDLAGVVVHTKEKNGDDVTIDVYVKDPSYLSAIMKAIYTYHPEFKTTLETYEDDNTRALDEALEKERKEHPENVDVDAEEEYELSKKYIKCVMPPVNKDRRDILNELVKLYNDKCMTDFDTLKAGTLVKIAPLCEGVPIDEVNKAKKEIDDGYDFYKDMAKKLAEEKHQQIEDAYNAGVDKAPEPAGGIESSVESRNGSMSIKL